MTAEGKKTGMKALLSAQSQLGVKPRILGVPGHDNKAVATEVAKRGAKPAWVCLPVSVWLQDGTGGDSSTVKTSASAKGC